MAQVLMTMSEEEEANGQKGAWQISFAFAQTMAVRSVVLLGVPDIMAAAGPDAALTVPEIAAQLPTQSPNLNLNLLSRIMRLLAAVAFFTVTAGHDGVRRYGLTPTAKWMLTRKHKYKYMKSHDDADDSNGLVSMAPQLLMETDEVPLAAWQMLHRSVLGSKETETETETETAFSAAHGGIEMWEYSAAHPRYNALFNSAMAANTRIFFKALLQSSYRGFNDVSSLVDVGGGIGVAAATIARAFPNVRRVVNMDLPHVISTAPALPGVEHVPGDMFHSVPSTHVVFLKWILHDWSDEDCIKILRNCRKAIPSNGKVIIADLVLKEAGGGDRDRDREKSDLDLDLDPTVGLVYDVMMAGLQKHGQERSEAEWQKLLEAAGFRRYNIFPLRALQSLIEAFP